MPDTLRKPYLVLFAVAANVALLAVSSAGGLGASPLLRANGPSDLLLVAPIVTTALALLLWHLAPRRSWAWLLLAGALCAVPYPATQAAPEQLLGKVPMDVLLAVALAGPPITIVGLLGGATLVWRSGWRAAAAGLIGTTLAIQVVEQMVTVAVQVGADSSPDGSTAWFETDFLPRLSLGLAALAVIAAVAGAAATSPRSDRPGPRVTAAAVLASAAPLVLLAWGSIRTAINARDLGDDLLHIGLVLLAAGLVAGAVAGRAALLGALVAGPVLSTISVLTASGQAVPGDLTTLTVVLTFGALLLGFLAARSTLRLRFGVGGLLAFAAGLLVLYFDDSDGVTISVAIVPVLILAGGVGVIAAVGTVGAELADRAAAPAVLVGLTAPIALGTTAIYLHLVMSQGFLGAAADRGLPETPLLLGVACLCVAAIALLGMTGALGRGAGDEPPETGVSAAVPAGEPGPAGTRT